MDFNHTDYEIQLLCEAVIEALCNLYDLEPIEVKIDGRLGKALGRAHYVKRLIRINTLILHNWPLLEDTLKHEFAHFLSYSRGYSGHGKLWQEAAKEVGANPSAIQPWQPNDLKANGIRWVYECGLGCKFYANRIKRRWSNAKCVTHGLPLTKRKA